MHVYQLNKRTWVLNIKHYWKAQDFARLCLKSEGKAGTHRALEQREVFTF